MVGDREAHGLAWLDHEVGCVHHRAAEARQRLPDSRAEQRRDRAREQASRREDGDVRGVYGLDDFRWRGGAHRLDGHSGDRRANLAHRGFASGDGSVGVVHHQREALRRRWVDAADDSQQSRRLLYAFAEAARDVGERRDDDVPDRVVAQIDSTLEAVVEHLGQPPAARQRHQAVPYVARRRDAELLSEAPARSAVIRDRDDRRDAAAGLVPQPPQEHR